MNRNIKNIRAVAKNLVDIEIKSTSIDFIVSHPFTNNIIVGVKGSFINILEEPERWRKYLKERIEKASITEILYLMIPPYRLLFIEIISEALSDKEVGELLAEFWQGIEDISGDANVSGKSLVKLLQRADKTTLMDSDELEKYNSLPDIVTLYRGVTGYNKKRVKAMSWTDNKEQALWFANRFQSKEKELWTIKVPKSQILACFSYENEFIVDLYSKRIKRTVEVL